MEFTTFTYITGIATLLGFAIQIFDVFPSHSAVRSNILILVVGVFLGSVIGALDASEIKLEATVNGFNIIVVLVVSVIIVSLLIATMSYDPRKRGEMYWVAGLGTPLLLLLLFAGSLGRIDHEADRIRNEKSRITISELLSLSELATNNKNYERALSHLSSVRSRLSLEDRRYDIILGKIELLKEQQVRN